MRACFNISLVFRIFMVWKISLIYSLYPEIGLIINKIKNMLFNNMAYLTVKSVRQTNIEGLPIFISK